MKRAGSEAVARGGSGAPRGWVLVSIALLVVHADPARAIDDPTCGVSPLVERSGAVEYVMPHGFVRAGSDSAWTAGHRLVRGVDYTLDRTRGILRLLREPVPGETLRVASCWLVDAPPLELQLHAYRPAHAPTDSVRSEERRVGKECRL